jgi:hypothetical protein
LVCADARETTSKSDASAATQNSLQDRAILGVNRLQKRSLPGDHAIRSLSRYPIGWVRTLLRRSLADLYLSQRGKADRADGEVAYGIATLMTNLFGRGKEPFWQASTNLVKFGFCCIRRSMTT